MEAKDAEVKKLLEEKNVELEEMKKRLKEQEREQQSEFLKLQMDVATIIIIINNCVCWYNFIELIAYHNYCFTFRFV